MFSSTTDHPDAADGGVAGRQRPSRPKLIAGAALAAGLTITALALAGCGATTSDPAGMGAIRLADDPTSQSFKYTGATQTYTVPDGVTSLSILAEGGAGGLGRGGDVGRSAGAEVTGTLAVQPGQQLVISVGGEGSDASGSNHDPKGGWGGLGANGGNGNSASDTLRTGGAGGGATTVQLEAPDGSNPQTIVIAAGGGGMGGPSGDAFEAAEGGSAGCTVDQDPSWQGQDGQNGSPAGLKGGRGGAAAGEPGMAGGRGLGGSGLGGNGGGGGGGANGGNPGTGAAMTSAAGGGGAGSSLTALMTDTTITCHVDGNDDGTGSGAVTITPTS